MKRERFASRVGLGMAVTEVGLEEDVKSHSTNTLSSLVLAPSPAKVNWSKHIHPVSPTESSYGSRIEKSQSNCLRTLKINSSCCIGEED